MTKNSGLRYGIVASLLLVATTYCNGCKKERDVVIPVPMETTDVTAPNVGDAKSIAEEAYIYGFPMLAGYKALYEFNVDKTNSQYKGPFNELVNTAHVATPKDTSIVTPNSDTPYSMLQADLRAEPLVICVPEVEQGRYYTVQLCDMYSCNYGYIGSRATGNDAGCFLVAGPDWKGEKPEGVKAVYRCETQFSFIIFRTQLLNPDDIDNVKAVQAGYKVQPLSAFLHQPAPSAAPTVHWLPFTEAAFKLDFPAYLDFLLQFCPEVPEEKELRARLASIGIGPAKTFDFKELPVEHKAEIVQAFASGFEKIEEAVASLGTDVNGWRVGAAQGDRAFYHGDWLLRAAAAKAGIYGNDSVEAMYPMTKTDSNGEPLDGSKNKYTLTFAPGAQPPVNAFWSVTMYDGKSQLLVENPMNRYLINSPMLEGLKKGEDGSLTLYIQKDSPGKENESNWLPAPDGPIYLVMRLYWPKTEEPSILPPGKGSWKPPAVVKSK